MKIIHTGDLHLDSKMESNLPTQKSKQRKNELLSTFSNLVDFAVKNEVRAVILAGDVFDSSKVTIKSRDYFFDCVNKAPNVDFLYLVGNHDEFSTAIGNRELPDNLKIFGNEWTCFEYEDIAINGVVLSENNCGLIYDSFVADSTKFNIVVLHGQESSSVGDGLIKISEFKNKNIDYLALGHIHSFKLSDIDKRGKYAYCGCLEGRGFDECGKKGFVLLDINNNKAEISFHSVARRTLHEVEVDITGLTTVTQIFDKINSSLLSISQDDLVKVVLIGSYNTNTQKNIDYILDELNNRFYFAKISDKTSLEINIDDYKNDISLKGEFIRNVLASSLSKEEKDQIIMYGIKALNGEDVE